MIKEFDVVKALKDLNDKVLKGSIGTVLMIYPGFPFAYTVEFVDNDFKTLDVLTVKANDIVLV